MATGAIVATMAGGTILEMAGNKKAARAKERAALAEAAMKRQMASDMLERFDINRKLTLVKGEQFKASQQAAFAKGGVDISSGATLIAMEDTNRGIQQHIDLERMEITAQANALIAGADIDTVLARDIKKASKFQNIGSFMSGAGQIAAVAGDN